MGKKRRLLTLPKCFSRVARSLETEGRDGSKHEGVYILRRCERSFRIRIAR
jgi:hypothetical protein